MANYVNEGEVLPYTPVAAVVAGAVVKIVDSVTVGYIGVANQDIAAAALGELCVEGVIEFSAKSADTFALGDVVYWDSINVEITTTSTAHCLAGRAAGAKSNGLIRVKINQR